MTYSHRLSARRRWALAFHILVIFLFQIFVSSSSSPLLIKRLIDPLCPIDNRSASHELLTLVCSRSKLAKAAFLGSPFGSFAKCCNFSSSSIILSPLMTKHSASLSPNDLTESPLRFLFSCGWIFKPNPSLFLKLSSLKYHPRLSVHCLSRK